MSYSSDGRPLDELPDVFLYDFVDLVACTVVGGIACGIMLTLSVFISYGHDQRAKIG